MAAGKYNMVVEQGAHYRVTFTYLDSNNVAFDLSGYKIRMAVKDHYTDTEFVYRATSNSTAHVGYLQHFTFGEDTGVFQLDIPSDVTETFVFNQGVYDLEAISSEGVVTRVIEGKFKVKPRIIE